MSAPYLIRIAHSPDADDLLMFLPLKEGIVRDDAFAFEFTPLDTHALNAAAMNGGDNAPPFDAIAISAALYPAISDDYLILRSGASVGRNYGPVLVTRTPTPLEALESGRIGVPGNTTTSGFLVRYLLPAAQYVIIPLSPYERVFDALRNGEVDAAALIHEGQLYAAERGLHISLELGQWWQRRTGLPLPLGLNVIRREIPAFSERPPNERTELRTRVANLLHQSVRFAVENSEQFMDTLVCAEQARQTDCGSRPDIARYLDCYANRDTIQMDADCLAALTELFALVRPDVPIRAVDHLC